MKRFLVLLLALVILLAATGCSSTAAPNSVETKDFTDSTGRTVTVPAQITSIAITGPLSQVYILPLAGELLADILVKEEAETFCVANQKRARTIEAFGTYLHTESSTP